MRCSKLHLFILHLVGVHEERGRHGPDLSGKARTADVTAAVIDTIHGANA